mgnify:CR=1 FL=1
MQFIPIIETGLLIAVTFLLLWAAVADIKHRRISNKIAISILILFGLWITVQLSKEVSFYETVVWPLVAAGVVFAVGAGLFAMRLMGGGDVKLLAVMALFAGPALSIPFVLYVVVAGGFVALGTLLHARLKRAVNDTPPKVPYGVAIMAGGLWVCFQRFSALSV